MGRDIGSFALAVRNWTLRTRPRSSGNTSITLPIGHWLLDTSSSLSSTMSSTMKFRLTMFHFWRHCNELRYSLRQRCQNSLARNCTLRHLFLQYRSSFSKTPGGGSTSLLFIVNSCDGDIGRRFGSLILSIVSGREFTTASASKSRVRKALVVQKMAMGL